MKTKRSWAFLLLKSCPHANKRGLLNIEKPVLVAGFFLANYLFFLYDKIMTDYKNILIIKLGALGDWIHLTGWYAAVRKKWPTACITLMTTKPFADLAERCPYFDTYIIDKRNRNPLDWWYITKRVLADGNYDLIIDMQRQKRTRQRYYTLARLLTKNAFSWANISAQGLLIRFTPPKYRFTWGTQQDFVLPLRPMEESLAFCKINPTILRLLPPKYVLLIPGCSPTHPYKRWPATHYRELALRLGKRNIYTVVLGTSTEQKEIETICKNNLKAINFCNKSTLFDIPGIAKKSLAVVGNDTGPQHMAELCDVPAITLFSEITKASQVKRRNITNFVAKNIKDISVDMVYKKLQSLWHKA